MFEFAKLICRKKLARRLLFDRYANEDHERLILTYLKQQCGGQFSSKMEGMVSSIHHVCMVIGTEYAGWQTKICLSQVTDLTLAKENQSCFEDYLYANPHAHPGTELSVSVLTTGFWPSYKSSDLTLPDEMVRQTHFLDMNDWLQVFHPKKAIIIDQL